MTRLATAAIRVAVGGISLSIESRHAALCSGFAELLARFPRLAPGETHEVRPGGWRVLLSPRRGLPLSPAMQAHARGSSPEGLAVEAGWRPGGRQLLVEGRLGVRACERRRVVVVRCGEAQDLLASTAGIAILDAILECERQYLQHGALLALPPTLAEAVGGNAAPGALLLFGESGAGKSSAALALARGGWPLGADDACVLREEAAGVRAWPYPRVYKVHRQTVALMPWLARLLPSDCEFDADGETVVEPAALAPDVALLQPSLAVLPVRALCWLGPRRVEGHAVRSLTAAETALRLSAEALSAPLRRLDASSRAQFGLFARMAREASWRFELSLGPDLAGLPAWLATTFRRSSDADRGQ